MAVNPLKKAVLETECEIHKFINIQALIILHNDKYEDAYSFFCDYIEQLNEGVVWADEDFKSSGHFYSPIRNRGLYGNRNALSLAQEYYDNALKLWHEQNNDKSMFFLGAAVHLVQDMTVPQHANIRLLDDHRQYESFIKRTYLNTDRFVAFNGGYYLNDIEEFIRCNARTAIEIFSRLKKISEEEERFYTISRFTLPLAQKTTAGCLMSFYKAAPRHGTYSEAGRGRTWMNV
jgi:phospholipase C